VPTPHHENRQQHGDDQPDEPHQAAVSPRIETQQQADFGDCGAEHRERNNVAQPSRSRNRRGRRRYRSAATPEPRRNQQCHEGQHHAITPHKHSPAPGHEADRPVGNDRGQEIADPGEYATGISSSSKRAKA